MMNLGVLWDELNGKYHTVDEIKELFSKLIGKSVDDVLECFYHFIQILERI